MKDFLSSITGAKVTFWIAVIGFFMSLSTWVKDLITQRVRLRARIVGCFELDQWDRPFLYLYLLIENLSRLPVSITNVLLAVDDAEMPCQAISELAYSLTETSGDDVTRRHEVYTDGLPVQLPTLGAQRVLLCFPNLPHAFPRDATQATLEVRTNRGNPKQMTLELPPDRFDQRIFL